MLLALALLWSSPAGASPLLELVGDPGATGGLNARHGDPGAFSTYFNPALLPAAEPQLSVRVLFVADPIDIEVNPRPDDSSVVSETASGAFRDGGSLRPVYPPPVPTSWLEQGCTGRCETGAISTPAVARPRQGVDSAGRALTYVGLGLVQPLAGRGLVAGLSVLMPVSRLPGTDGFYNDEREQYFSNSLHAELYGDRLAPLGVAFGLGSQLTDRLSLGLSFTLNLASAASSATFVPQSAEYGDLSLSNDVRMDVGLTPHFGAAYRLLKPLLLTATVHTPQAFRVEAGFSSLLPDGSEQFARRRFTHHYVPLIGALGARYDIDLGGGHSLGVVGGLAYEGWSSYRDRHDQRPGGPGAPVDVFHPSLGLRHAVGDWSSGADASFLASPFGQQQGRDNYVDNDRLGLSLALRRAFSLAGVKLRAGLSLQAHRLLARAHRKIEPGAGNPDPDLVQDEVPDDAVEKLDIDEPVDPRDGLQTNNPGYPGFSSRGYILAAALSVDVLF